VITAGAVGLVGVVLGVLILRRFPSVETLVEAETFTNVFAHAAGFLWGMLVFALILIRMHRPRQTKV